MRPQLYLCLLAFVAAPCAEAAQWQVQRIDAPARVTAVDSVDGKLRVEAGGLWYAVKREGDNISLAFIDYPALPKLPEGALPDSRIATGKKDIARAWLAEPTTRYDHGILGDKIEASALVIETRNGETHTVRLGHDAVFEDLEPRIADLNGDGHDEVVVVKSYLKRGSALAVIGERRGRYEILAETPPLGAAHRWLDPIGIADFTGGGKPSIALVRQPHVVGMLELWDWHGGRLHKVAEIPDAANHIAGSRAIHMAAIADFDGDGKTDIAVPSLDRGSLRIISFAPQPREIDRIKLPAKAATDIGLLTGRAGTALVLGLADGSLVLVKPMP